MTAAADAAAAPTPAEAYRAALDAGRLVFQRCGDCGRAWLPAREECPGCWSPQWSRQEASGRATVVSRVVFHTAFDRRFAERLPYDVTLVELEEGPRMVTNLIGPLQGGDVIGRRATLVFEEDMGRRLPRFRLREEA